MNYLIKILEKSFVYSRLFSVLLKLIKKLKNKKLDDFSYYDECVKNNLFSPAYKINKNTN